MTYNNGEFGRRNKRSPGEKQRTGSRGTIFEDCRCSEAKGVPGVNERKQRTTFEIERKPYQFLYT